VSAGYWVAPGRTRRRPWPPPVPTRRQSAVTLERGPRVGPRVAPNPTTRLVRARGGRREPLLLERRCARRTTGGLRWDRASGQRNLADGQWALGSNAGYPLGGAAWSAGELYGADAYEP
jgi:hypothetical protein